MTKEETPLTAEIRRQAGKGAARSFRRQGRVPAVIYGDKTEPVLISLDSRALEQELHKPGFFTRVLDVAVDGKPHRVLAREIQLDPVTDRPLHVDFLRFSAHATIRVSVPVVFRNEETCPGVKRGGVLNVVRHEIEVACRAGNIPQTFAVDLQGLDIGDSVHITDLHLPEGVTPTIAERDFTIATIAAPTVKAVEEEEAAAEVTAVAEEVAPVEGVPAEGARKSREKKEGGGGSER